MKTARFAIISNRTMRGKELDGVVSFKGIMVENILAYWGRKFNFDRGVHLVGILMRNSNIEMRSTKQSQMTKIQIPKLKLIAIGQRLIVLV